MRRFLVVALLGLAIVSTAKADGLKLTDQFTGTNPTTWDPTTQASPLFTVGVQQDSINPYTGLVQGWSLGLWIKPESGASGTVSLDVPPLTGSPPTATVPLPSNYLFASDNSGSILLTMPTAPIQVLASDVATDSGVTVPLNGANLLALSFLATSGATGKFDIFTLGDMTIGSYWVDSNFGLNALANVPFGTTAPGAPVLLGTLTLIQRSSVPEPHSALLLLCGGGGSLLLYGRVRRRTTGLAA